MIYKHLFKLQFIIELMGKQQTDKIEQPQKQQQPPKKKIIKKLVTNKLTSDDKDELKDWKPTKIAKIPQNKSASNSSNNDIATNFLMSLPEPNNLDPNPKNSKFNDLYYQQPKRPQPKMKIDKPTPQQIKWDINDQSFIKKQFMPLKQGGKIVEEAEDEPEDFIDEKGRKQTIKKIDITEIIDNNWREEAQRRERASQLYSATNGILDGKGRVSKLVKQAQSKAYEIEESLNQRDHEKKQMRDRYGW